MLEEGRGVDRDRVLACAWALRAERKGYRDAGKITARLRAKLTREEYAEAVRISR